MLRSLLVTALLLLVTLNTGARTNTQSLPSNFFFFGDSLSDSGYQNNNPIVKRLGKTPQWTSPHGHTWVYYFLQNYAKKFPSADTRLLPNNVDAATLYHPVPTHINPILNGNNFAAGGSTTGGTGILNTKQYKSPSLLEQVNYFVSSYVPQRSINLNKSKILIWSGSNDLIKKLAVDIWLANSLKKWHLSQFAALTHLFNVNNLPAGFYKTQTQIANNLSDAVTTLQKAGAHNIVVILLPDVGDTPLIGTLAKTLRQHGNPITTTQLSAQMQQVTQQTNQLIRTKFTDKQVRLVDINTVLKPIIGMNTPGIFQESSHQFGKQSHFLITNNKGTACRPTEKALTCIPMVANAQHYVFEDLVHPTDQTHQLIGDYVYYQTLNH